MKHIILAVVTMFTLSTADDKFAFASHTSMDNDDKVHVTDDVFVSVISMDSTPYPMMDNFQPEQKKEIRTYHFALNLKF